MKIKDLRKHIKGLPADMLVCGSGHFGEVLEMWSADISKVHYDDFFARHEEKFDAFVMQYEDPGEEPE